MILDILSRLERDKINSSALEQDKVRDIQVMKNLLSEIDFEAEVVPLDDRDRLVRIIESLKGQSLTDGELEVVSEILVD